MLREAETEHSQGRGFSAAAAGLKAELESVAGQRANDGEDVAAGVAGSIADTGRAKAGAE